ncbi:hypothetical protein FNF31_06108 [Cafeteria roenbergensis]|uniref:Uncharacterized protein n=1 Tax=Cafeteria roenbergensis TaxID=33653 RepID=A0A5A8CRE8_CAFRO|nr:hypothetical protein FNF31_06108 [Cafeteria roenbergensis]
MSFLFGGHDTDADEPRVRLLAEQLQGADAVTDQLEVLTDALAMAKRRRLLFGKRGTDSLCSLLKRPELDPEVAQSLLETLLALVDPSQDGPSDAEHAASQREAAGLNAARFLGDPAATGALLDLAASEATWTRVLCVQLLAALNAAKPDMASAALLRTEQGLSRLLDRLADRKEEVRNEVLVLLGSLTRGSSNLQSYVAFEDGHSRLLGLAAREAGAVRRLARRFAAPGSGAPGAVVPPHRFDVALDAVKIVANVLGGNAITRKLFVQSAEPLRDALAVLDAAVQIGKASPRSLELASAGLAVLEALAGAPDGRSRDRAAGAASGVGGIVAAAPPAAPRVAVAGSRKSDASKAGSAESSSAGNGAAAASSRAEDEDEDEEAVDPSTAAANAAADSAVAAAIGTEPLLWDGLGRVAFSNRLPAPIAARAAAVLTAVVRAGGSRAQITAAMSAVRDVATGVDPHSFLLPQAATDSPGAAPVDPASAALADALELAPAGSAAASAVGRLLIPSLAVRTSLSASDPAWADAACSLAAAVAWPAALPASSPTPREGSARGTGRETAVDDAGPATAVSHILSPPPVPPSDAADDAAALPPITALQAAASALVTASRRLTNVAGDCDGPAAAALAAVAARASRLLAGAFSASAACGQLALRVGLRVEAGGGLAEALAAKGAARPGQLGMCRGSADAALLPLLVGTLASLSTSGHTAPALSVLVASVAELVAAWAGTCPSVAIEAARSGADAALAATFARRVVHHDLPSHARVAAAAAVAAVSGIARAVGSDASAQLRSALLDAVGVAGADQCLRLAATQPPRSSSSSPPEPDHPAVAWVLPRPEEEGVGDSSGVPAGASRAVRWCSAATSVRLYVPPAPGSDERAGPRAPGPATVVLLSSSAAARAAELRAWIRKGFLDAAMSDSADADGTAGDGGASAEEALPEPWATRWRIAKEILSLPASEAASAGAAQPAAGWRTQPGSGPPQAAQGQDGGAQALVMFGGRRITVAEAEAELERAGRRADQAGAALKDASSSLRDAQSAARAANAEAESLRAVSGGDAGTLAELKLAYDSIRGSFADAQRGRVAAEDEVKELQAALEAARADAEGLRASASAAAERAAAATAAAASAQEAGPSAEEAEAAVQAVRDELERVRAAHAQEVAVLRADLEASLDGGDMGPSADAGKIEELELQVADASRRAEASDAAAAAARKDAEEARAEAAEARAAAEEARAEAEEARAEAEEARERGAAEVEAAAQEAEAERASAAEARDQVAAARAEAESLRTGAHATDEDVAAARRAAAEAASRSDSLECQVRKLQEALEDERAETHKAADRERAKAAAVADEATREAESRVQAAERRAAEQLRAAELEVLRGEHEDLLVLCAALDVELSIAYEAVQSLGGAEAAAACRRLTAERLGEAAEDQGSSAEVLAELSMAGDASFDASALFGQQHQQQPQHVGGSGSGAAGLFASALDDGDDADDTQDGPRDHHPFFSASPPESPDAGAVPSTASRVFAQSGGAAGHDTVWAEEHGADWQDHGTGGWAEYQDGSGGHSDWPEQPDSDPATGDALATADQILPAGRMGAETPAQGWEPAADAPPSHGMFSAGQPRGGALLAQGAPEQGSVAESQHVWSTGHDAADEAEQLQADGAQQAQADEHEQLQDEEEIPLDASDHGFSSAQNADEPSSMFGDAHQSASPPRAVGSEAGESSFSATLVSVLFGGDVAPSPDKRSHSQSRAAPPAAPPAPAADRQGQGSSAHDFATAVSAGLSTWGSHGGLALAAANGGAGGGRDLSEAGDGQGGDEFDEDDDDDVDGGANSSFIDAVSGYAGVLASLVGKSEGPAATQGSQAREGASQSKPMFGGSLSSSTAPPVQVQAVVAGQPSADPARGPVGQTAAPPGSALPAASPPKMSAPPTATSMFAPAHGATRKAKRGRRALYPGAAHVAAEPQDPQPPRPATASGPPPAVFKPAVSRPPAPSPAPTIPEGALSLPVQRPTVTAELAPAAAATFHASPGEPEDAQEEEENAAAFFSPVQPASVFGTVGDGADSRSARLGLPAASTAKALFGQQGPRVERAKPADAVFATQSADAEGEGLDHDDDADGASAWF